MRLCVLTSQLRTIVENEKMSMHNTYVRVHVYKKIICIGVLSIRISLGQVSARLLHPVGTINARAFDCMALKTENPLT